MSEPRALVEHFFRHEFGRLVAVLTRSLGVRHLALVEDVVQATLVSALLTDIAWVREQTRLQALALGWAKTGSRANDLLRGGSLDEAERWASRRPTAMPALGETLSGFIAMSRQIASVCLRSSCSITFMM